MAPRKFAFDIEPRYVPMLALFGVIPARTSIEVDETHLRLQFGFMKRSIRLDNIAGIHPSGPYKWYRAIGIRWSFSDHGLTYGTTTAHGVCIEFHQPIPGQGPLAFTSHPNLTLTPAEPDSFVAAIKS